MTNTSGLGSVSGMGRTRNRNWKRNRIRDARKAEIAPQVVQFDPTEHYADRHRRRLSTNLEFEPAVREWCEKHGVDLRVTNEGHHWQFRAGKMIAEWWPSSAKLVLNKHWRRGIHVHDIYQLFHTLEREWLPKERGAQDASVRTDQSV